MCNDRVNEKTSNSEITEIAGGLLAQRLGRRTCAEENWENFWGSCPDCPWEHVCQI